MTLTKYREFLNVVTAMVAILLSFGISSVSWKIIFIIVYLLGVWFLFYSDWKEKNWKNFFGVLAFIICVLILLASVYNLGSIGNYIKKVKNFFSIGQNINNQLTDLEYEKYTDYFKNINEQLIEMNEHINILDNDIGNLSDNIKYFSFSNNKKNQEEIDNILEQIEKHIDNFSDLKINKYQVELFYKMKLSENLYYHCNIIEAFNQYGIDCEKMGIDEYTLVIWDIHTLYAFYNMKESIKYELDSDKIYDKKILYFKDYKVEMSEYSDTLVYDTWSYPYKDKTAKEIDEALDKKIMMYYKKFIMNFSKNDE